MKFWAILDSRAAEKKNPNCNKYATFGGVFFNFLWENFFENFFEKYFSICTEKLHSIKVNKKLKSIGKYLIGYKLNLK